MTETANTLREKTERPDIVERLHFFCTDWDGRRMDSEELVMDGLLCGELLDAATEITRLRHELGLAREDLAGFRSERSYVIGCNTGWGEAIEQASQVIEAYAQRLKSDPANDRARYHVRCAADDVRALLAELDRPESEVGK